MKVLIYALGGGLGHVTRAYKLSQFLKQKFSVQSVWVLASFQVLPDFLRRNLNIVWVFPYQVACLADVLKKLVLELKPDIWLTDVLPNGLRGELPMILGELPSSLYKIMVVRILKEPYCRVFPEMLYDEAWQIEWLPEYMKPFVRHLACKHYTIQLSPLQNLRQTIQNKRWIIHTGSSGEIQGMKRLYPDFEVITPDVYFPLPLLKNCEVVTAAGYNILHDLSYLVDNHYIYPQNRKWDDQSLRYQNFVCSRSLF